MPTSRRKSLILMAALGFTGLLSACAHPLPQPEHLSWNYFFDGQEAKLAYGRPNSDEVGLMMTCAPHSGSVLVSSDATAGQPRLILASGKAVSTLQGSAEVDPLTGTTQAHASASLHDAALTGFARSGKLSVKRDGHALAMPASLGDRDAVRRFFSACA